MSSDVGEPSTLPVGFVASRIAQSRKRVRHSEPSHRQICPHCNQSLCSKTFKKHKRLYQKGDGSWVVTPDSHSTETEESK